MATLYIKDANNNLIPVPMIRDHNGKTCTTNIGIALATINKHGELVITYTNGQTTNLGVVVGAKGDKGEKGDQGIQGEQGLQGITGKDGQDGKDGIGIEKIEINEDSELVITYTDGNSVNLGQISPNIDDIVLKNLLDGSSDGSLRSKNAIEEDDSYTIGENSFALGYDAKTVGYYNSIFGGIDDIIYGYANGILAGEGNKINSNETESHRCGIVAGASNEITDSYDSGIIGGYICKINDSGQSLVGGNRNTIQRGDASVILGGCYNQMISNSSGHSHINDVMFGGAQNRMYDSTRENAIIGGQDNHIYDNSQKSIILGGRANKIHPYCDGCSIVGGEWNGITNSYDTFISGSSNNIYGSNYSFIYGHNNYAKNIYDSFLAGSDCFAGNLTEVTDTLQFINSLYTTTANKFSATKGDTVTVLDTNLEVLLVTTLQKDISSTYRPNIIFYNNDKVDLSTATGINVGNNNTILFSIGSIGSCSTLITLDAPESDIATTYKAVAKYKNGKLIDTAVIWWNAGETEAGTVFGSPDEYDTLYYIGSSDSINYVNLFGYHNLVFKDNQFVCGTYNEPNPDALFQIGNGTDESSRSNAFEVLNDGTVLVNGSVVDGSQSTPISHEWEGTSLILTTSSGTTVTNLEGPKGDKGDKGDKGETGATGNDGVSVTKTEINQKGELIITLSDNTVSNLGIVVGTKGEKGDKGDKGDQGTQGETGATGNGIASATINEYGELVIVYTNGDDINLGNVIGAKGETGAAGADGLTPFINAKGNWQIGEEDTGIKATGNSTSGENGLTPHINVDGNWQIGDQDTGVAAAGINGTNGDSAYDIAKKNGFVGTEEEWLDSLKGKDGLDGSSGVYYGEEEPTDPSVKVWVDPSGHADDFVTVEQVEEMINNAINNVVNGDEVAY